MWRNLRVGVLCWQQLAAAVGRDVIAVSAVTGQGLDRLLKAVVALLDGRTQ